MLNENSVVRLTKNILKRYESSIKDGVMFLFDIETDEVWTGSSSTSDLIKLINGQRTLKEIYAKLQPLFENYSYDELKESFDIIINDLLTKKFLEQVNS